MSIMEYDLFEKTPKHRGKMALKILKSFLYAKKSEKSEDSLQGGSFKDYNSGEQLIF